MSASPRQPREAAAASAHWILCSRADVPPGDDWLSQEERVVLARLRLPKRRGDWLVGRWAAKQVLARALAGPGEEHDLADIRVLAAEDGAPEAFLRGGRVQATITISHSGEVGFAVAATTDVPLGCDVERVEARSLAFVRDYFTAAEAEQVEGAAPPARALLATLLWSAKESALKLRREGLRADTRSVDVRLEAGGSAARGRFTVRAQAGETVRGCWWRSGEYVCTVAAALPADPPEWAAPEASSAWTLPPG